MTLVHPLFSVVSTHRTNGENRSVTKRGATENLTASVAVLQPDTQSWSNGHRHRNTDVLETINNYLAEQNLLRWVPKSWPRNMAQTGRRKRPEWPLKTAVCSFHMTAGKSDCNHSDNPHCAALWAGKKIRNIYIFCFCTMCFSFPHRKEKWLKSLTHQGAFQQVIIITLLLMSFS